MGFLQMLQITTNEQAWYHSILSSIWLVIVIKNFFQHLASSEGNQEIVEFLLESKADLDLRQACLQAVVIY